MAYTKYTKTKWVDKENSEFSVGTSPSVCADNLNKVEQGIYDSVRRSGDKMEGALELYRSPQSDMEAANKGYVDNTVLSIKKITASSPGSENGNISGTYFKAYLTEYGTKIELTKDFQEIFRFTPTKISGEAKIWVYFNSVYDWDGYYIDYILYEDNKIIEELSNEDGVRISRTGSCGGKLSFNVGKTYRMVARRSEKCHDDRNPLSVTETELYGYIIDDYEQYFNFG